MSISKIVDIVGV